MSATFMDRYLANELGPKSIDDFIEAWHQGDSPLPLADYLGMTCHEYTLWLMDAGALPHIRDRRLHELSGDSR